MIILALGLFAGALTTFAWLPQLYRTWRSGRADDVSYGYLVALVVGISGWLVYGILAGQAAVIAANGFSLVFVVTQVAMKRWPRHAAQRNAANTPSMSAVPDASATSSSSLA